MTSLLRLLLLCPLLASALLPHSAPFQPRHHLRHSKHHAARDWAEDERPQADAPSPVQESSATRESSATAVANEETLEEYAQRNCSRCLSLEEKKRAAIDRVKRDILDKIGFSEGRLPNASATHDFPSTLDLRNGPLKEAIKKAFPNMPSDSPNEPFRPDESASDTLARVERIYSFARPPPSEFEVPEDMDVAYFEFSSETIESRVTKADLNVYLRKPSEPVQQPYIEVKVELYKLTEKGRKVHKEPFKTQKERFDPRNGRWVAIPVKSQVRNWFEKPSHNYGLQVQIMYNGENLAIHPRQNDSKKNMYLDITTEEGSRRQKRDTRNLECREDGTESRCCRYKLIIDFEAFGWDWVIAPKKYMGYYCAGDCPYTHLSSFIHTKLARSALPDGSAGPCCYPTDLAPIMMVYLNEKKEVLVSQIPGMVVNRCGCA